MVMAWLIREIFGTSGMTESRFVLDTNAVIFLLPDCIVAATAIVLNATLLTADVKLLRLELPGFNAKNIF